MPKPNQHINDFLKHYCKLQTPPQYAVMLKGKWGSGKTHYINKVKKFLKRIDKKYIYVSLYGVKTNSEILSRLLKNDIFSEVSQNISNNKVNAVLSWFKDIASDKLLTNKLISNEVLQMKILESYIVMKECIFIFDDLERCEAPINKILGFINIFVEHKNSKVIILSNEKELKKKNKDYKNIKEKLIGKTFELIPEVDLAYKSFIEKLDKNIFIKYKETIKGIYKKSKCSNLRILRQTILDFDRFYENILIDYEEPNFVKDFIQIYFILSFEHKNNKLDILKMKEDSVSDGIPFNENKEKEIETINKKLTKKYAFDIHDSKILAIDLWNDILDKSIINKKKIKEAILSSKYYANDKMPNWKRLWHFRELEDDELSILFEKIKDELVDKKLNNIFEVLHVCSTLLYLDSKNLITIDKNEILDFSKNHIDYLYEDNKIENSIFENQKFVLTTNLYETLTYATTEDSYFIDLRKYLKTVLEKGINRIEEDDVSKIIECIANNDTYIYTLLSQNSLENTKYFEKAILSKINIDDLMSELKDVNRYRMDHFGFVLSERYVYDDYNKELMNEITFLNNLNEKLSVILKEREGRVSGYNLIYFLSKLKVAIDNLQKYIDNNK